MNLEKISLIISVVGIIFLLILSQKLEPKEMKISDISNKMIEGYAKIRGDLVSIKSLDNMQILKIEDKTGIITAVVYGKTNLSNGTRVEIIGKVVRYRGSLEIEVQKIRVVE